MATKNDFVARIVAMEWKMFSQVSNTGGRANCQEDSVTFEIMRSSQAASWSDPMIESYLADITEAEQQGRNLMSEKYARMMETTAPLEYSRIEHLLPRLDPQVSPLIDRIVEIVLQWEEELSAKYPHIVKRGRPLRSMEDAPFATSFETYLRCELATYSVRTLELYLKHASKEKAEGVNGAEITLEYIVRRYGYESLEEANERLQNYG